MDWWKLVVQALVTVIVTIVGSIITYNLTVKKDSKDPTVDLQYSTLQPSSFSGPENEISIVPVKIFNFGEIPASSVELNIKFTDGEISDHSVEELLSSDLVDVNSRSLSVVFERLLPDESRTVSILSNTSERPSISLRSDEVLGKPFDFKSSFNEEPSFILPIFAIAFGMLMVSAWIKLWRNLKGRTPSSSKNNIGFILAHGELPELAHDILENAVIQGEDAPYTIANLALASGLKGNMQIAEKLFEAAQRFGGSKRFEATLLFNQSILSLKTGEIEDFYVKIEKALSIDEKMVRDYIQYCSHTSVVENENRFTNLLNKTSWS